MKKKLLALLMVATMALTIVGCGEEASTPEATQTPAADTQEVVAEEPAAAEETTVDLGAITVVSREDGSGTRGAFIELVGVEQKDADGNKVDYTTDMAEISNSTSVVMTTVAGNTAAIGYISLGSLNDTVKALEIDGVAATVDNIKDGSYSIARPFNIVTKDTVSELAQDFINFIMSAEGQAIVESNGYISQGNTGAFATTNPSGELTVAGSSSVTPVMEKLKEAYLALNAAASVEVQQSDSSTGVSSVVDGICEIGMASRELKDSEVEKGVVATVIAMDGIAVIANLENPIVGLTKDQVRDIYTGALTTWSEVTE